MTPSRTLSFYIGRRYLFWLVSVSAALIAIIMLADVLELLRRASGRDDYEGISIVIRMTLLKLPAMFEKILPIAALLGAVFAFWSLNRHHELVVIRAAGVSIWQFLTPAILLAVAVGIFKVAVFNPFSSAMLLQYEILEAKHLRGKDSLAAVANRGLWFRQRTEDGYYILHARSMQNLRLNDVVTFRMLNDDRLTARIDSPRAHLEEGHWRLDGATVLTPDGRTERREALRLSTNLTRENIDESFAPPETISFWALPAFVRALESAGLKGARHKLQWHAHLALPLMLAAVTLLAATFSLRPVIRGRSGSILIVAGCGLGFLVYFLTDVVHALGLSSSIPVAMAAWSPPLVSSFVGVGILLHLEDG